MNVINIKASGIYGISAELLGSLGDYAYNLLYEIITKS